MMLMMLMLKMMMMKMMMIMLLLLLLKIVVAVVMLMTMQPMALNFHLIKQTDGGMLERRISATPGLASRGTKGGGAEPMTIVIRKTMLFL